ncbi:phosphomethylpyrimidine kinase [Halogeometricum borinquense DSM 11551]|uniref:Phosphomethylpyrimidine kinase n=1 Tax=Halogeometricum borinquense (strain ATCC 700274 / DSM 11551 / JCM 10706 / KCTC 4070 / PR3) TaxID=469382 RepID=E4NUZ7_HALBP|nr:bifunctional hydroxymethylpyrimidine kinase/phosphomethylpyrimidine kinase [Halogeometricum borinquense]ADQ68986.1 phosphomethylpyrimidine kinase [Halogeometricum borinquense DSM 11551]ELY29191.1 phosphomethylpyrimidine kinase [Halogeometricum borinquense DSM 11551]
MIRPDPQTPPYALTIASGDSGGGAGIQADLKTMTRLGVYGGSVIVGVTSQNTRGVRSTHVLPSEEIRAQFDAVHDDFDIGAVKLGMLATADAVRTVDDCLDAYDGAVVIDPVMVAASGDRLLELDAIDAYTDLFAQATLVTPNADETEELTGEWPDSDDARDAAASQFFEWGADAVLFKGGHVAENGDEIRDILVTQDGSQTFASPRIDTETTHGSGCTLSSAIAARLARGDDLSTAVERGISFVRAAIERPAAVGENGSVNHLVDGELTIEEFDN